MEHGILLYVVTGTEDEWEKFLEIANKNGTNVVIMKADHGYVPRAEICGIPRFGTDEIRKSLHHVIGRQS